MKLSVLLVALSVPLVVSCSHVREKETVIEKPTVTRETVIEQQPILVEKQPTIIEKETVVERAVPTYTYQNCSRGSMAYSHGTINCHNRAQYRCDNGIWTDLNAYC